jgi:aspartyl-tRNA(Asn)/glutamyl-tRNA(Gln) amidotransferase subunit A
VKAASALDEGVQALLAAYASGGATPLAVLDVIERRVAETNGPLNILVHADFAGARAAATESAAHWRSGTPPLALDGVPVVVKANIAVEGLPWTAGVSAYRDRIATEDAFVVARLREAGAVIVGIVNMHEAALGATTDGPLYGKAFNPLRAGFTPGGSSGGSAAAVAAGYAAAALGSDTMGSVRIPAAYCGGVGFKPTYGVLSQRGLANLSWTLDHIGVHARNPDDADTVFRAMAGYDEGDRFAEEGPLRLEQTALTSRTYGRLRYVGRVACSPDVDARFDEACAKLAGAGARVIDVTLADYDFGRMRRAGLVVCEAEGGAEMAEALTAHPDGFSPALRALLDYGASLPASRLAQTYREIAAARLVARKVFGRVDFLLTPTAPQTAFPHDAPAPSNQADFTAFANLAGLPAASIPMGAGENGLPTGLQIIAPRWADMPLMSVAGAIARLLQGG